MIVIKYGIMIGLLACSLACADSLSITDYGATGNDKTDDTGPITAALVAARSQHKWVYIPKGTFYHNSFSVLGTTLKGCGDSSVLYAANSQNAVISVNGIGSQLLNFKAVIKSQSRVGTLTSCNILIQSASNFLIQNITVDGADAVGIMMYGSSNGKVLNNHVSNTLADAIHSTDGSHDIIVANNVVRNSGDDMVAVVSYGSDPAFTHNILVQGNDLANQLSGRGISVIGGQNVTIIGNKIKRSACAGIIVATESSFSSMSDSNILIENNTVDSAKGTVGHPGILVSASNQPITDVLFRNNAVSHSVNQGVRIEGGAAPNVPTNIGFINTTLLNNSSGFVVNQGSNIYCTGTTINGAASNTCTGTLNFTVTGCTLTYDSTATKVVFMPEQKAASGGLQITRLPDGRVSIFVPFSGAYTLRIINAAGRLVASVTGNKPAGHQFSKQDLKSGVYLVRLDGSAKVLTTMMLFQ